MGARRNNFENHCPNLTVDLVDIFAKLLIINRMSSGQLRYLRKLNKL